MAPIINTVKVVFGFEIPLCFAANTLPPRFFAFGPMGVKRNAITHKTKNTTRQITEMIDIWVKSNSGMGFTAFFRSTVVSLPIITSTMAEKMDPKMMVKMKNGTFTKEASVALMQPSPMETARITMAPTSRLPLEMVAMAPSTAEKQSVPPMAISKYPAANTNTAPMVHMAVVITLFAMAWILVVFSNAPPVRK